MQLLIFLSFLQFHYRSQKHIYGEELVRMFAVDHMDDLDGQKMRQSQTCLDLPYVNL